MFFVFKNSKKKIKIIKDVLFFDYHNDVWTIDGPLIDSGEMVPGKNGIFCNTLAEAKRTVTYFDYLIDDGMEPL